MMTTRMGRLHCTIYSVAVQVLFSSRMHTQVVVEALGHLWRMCRLRGAPLSPKTDLGCTLSSPREFCLLTSRASYHRIGPYSSLVIFTGYELHIGSPVDFWRRCDDVSKAWLRPRSAPAATWSGARLLPDADSTQPGLRLVQPLLQPKTDHINRQVQIAPALCDYSLRRCTNYVDTGKE
jgi:hypothetical protein